MKLAKALLFALCTMTAVMDKAQACECSAYGSILYGINYYVQNGFFNGKNIVLSQITSINGYGISVKILDHYYGTDTLADTVKIWGDPGWTCRGNPLSAYVIGDSVNTYKVGDSIIYILDHLADEWGVQTSYESLADYALDCEFSSIYVHGDSVYGGSFLATSIQMPLTGFLDSMNTILNAPVVAVQNVAIAPENFIFPNPATHDITVQSSALQAKELLHIFDMNGRLVQEQELQFANGQSKLHTDLTPGIYGLQLMDQAGHTKTEKLIINR